MRGAARRCFSLTFNHNVSGEDLGDLHFALHTPGRVLLMRAASQVEKVDWLLALHKCGSGEARTCRSECAMPLSNHCPSRAGAPGAPCRPQGDFVASAHLRPESVDERAR